MENLNKFAYFAKISYQDFKDVENLKFINDPISGMQYYLYKKDETLWILFRGTDSLQDVLTDIYFFKHKIFNKKIKIHAGFLNNYLKQRDVIFSYIDTKIKKINITGHSYGGALALLCAIDTSTSIKDIDIETVVFGAPRIGNKHFRKAFLTYGPKTTCVINGNDLIPSLPPYLFGFRRVGKKLHIGAPNIPVFFSLKDHRMENYTKQLKDYTNPKNLPSFLNTLRSKYRISS